VHLPQVSSYYTLHLASGTEAAQGTEGADAASTSGKARNLASSTVGIIRQSMQHVWGIRRIFLYRYDQLAARGEDVEFAEARPTADNRTWIPPHPKIFFDVGRIIGRPAAPLVCYQAYAPAAWRRLSN